MVQRQAGSDDRRVHEAVVTAEGKAMVDVLDAARERLAQTFFSKWNKRDFEELVRLVVKFADQIGSGR